MKFIKTPFYAYITQLVFLINVVYCLREMMLTARIKILRTHKFHNSYKNYLIHLSSLTETFFVIKVKTLIQTSAKAFIIDSLKVCNNQLNVLIFFIFQAIKISHAFTSKIRKIWSYALITELN